MNVTDRAGRTSLHHAAFNGHVEVIYSNMYKNISLIIENLINTYTGHEINFSGKEPCGS